MVQLRLVVLLCLTGMRTADWQLPALNFYKIFEKRRRPSVRGKEPGVRFSGIYVCEHTLMATNENRLRFSTEIILLDVANTVKSE